MDDLIEVLTRFEVLQAFWVTIQLAVTTIIGSSILGLVIAVMRVSPSSAMRAIGSIYIFLFRNTPLTFLVVLLYVGIAITVPVYPLGQSAPLAWNIFFWAWLGLTLYHAAYICEALRSGVNTVDLGQAEAARAIGLSFVPSLVQVILPQALRGALAPLGNAMVALIKNTTVAAAIGVAGPSVSLAGMIEFRPDLGIISFLIIAVGFVILTLPVGYLFTSLSQRLAVRR